MSRVSHRIFSMEREGGREGGRGDVDVCKGHVHITLISRLSPQKWRREPGSRQLFL